MEYVLFSLWFTLVHTGAYVLAGVIALALSRDLYAERDRVLDFLRDMSNPSENAHVQRTFLPAQLARGVLLSVVLYPVLGTLTEASFAVTFGFFASLTFVYLELASSIPFSTNIEGFVYLRQRYWKVPSRWKLYLEAILYSVLLGLAMAWILS